MMMSKTFAAMASLGLLILPFASASSRQDVGALGDPNQVGTAVAVSSIGGGPGAASEVSTPHLLDAPRAATPEEKKKGVTGLDGGSGGLSDINGDAAHPGLRGLSVPKPDCKPTNPPPKGKGGVSPSKVKVSKAKTMDYGKGKGKGQVKSKGSKAGMSKAKKAKTGKGGCSGSGCGMSKSKQPGKGKVKDAKTTSKGPKGSAKCAKMPKDAKSTMGHPKSPKGCTGCPPVPKPTPPKPTKPTTKCTDSPTTMAPTANIEMPTDDTCERQCMQWVSQNCVVLDELGAIMEDHCVVPFPFDDDLFGRSLGEAGTTNVAPVTSKPLTVQEKIDYHRRMAHVYQQVLSLID